MAVPDWLYANKYLFHWVGWLLTRQLLSADPMYSSLGL